MLATSWREVWERKGTAQVACYDHETLIALDGFEGGSGRLSPSQFAEIGALAARKLQLGPGKSLLEVGCGAGALLWTLRAKGLALFGVDYAPTMLEHARAAIPEARFAVAEAASLPFSADAIVCHSVFQYFDDYDYAQRALAEFRRVAGGVLVLDVPDLDTREECERMRVQLGSKPGSHLYYPRSFFEGSEVWTNVLPGYANGPFRFNALFELT